MGRKGTRTGTRLLGAELRRLRGTRTLKRIQALSKTPPFSDKVSPVGVATLSQIETGVSFPSLETLHSLSVIYQTSMQRLLDLVVQERIADRVDLSDTLAECEAAFADRLGHGKWHDALAFAVRGEELATSASSRILVRASRAMCMSRIGLRNDAIQMLLEAAHEPCVELDRRYRLFQVYAGVLASAGHLEAASDAASRAVRLVPSDLEAGSKWPLLLMRAQLQIRENDLRAPVDRAAVEEAIQSLNEACSLMSPREVQSALIARMFAAVGRKLLGEKALAARQIDGLSHEAGAAGHSFVQMCCLMNAACWKAEEQQWALAESLLCEAESIAMSEPYIDEAFEIYFALYRVATHRDEAAGRRYPRRCERFHPLVQARTPAVREYELLGRGGK